MSKKATKRELVRRKRQVARKIFLKKSSRRSYDRPDDFKVDTSDDLAVETPVEEKTEE